MSELKPCPFCGSKPEQYDNEYACCTGSKCPMANMVIDNRVWNTRAVLAQEAGKVEPVMKLEAERLWEGDGEYWVSFVKSGWLDECRKTGGTFLLYTSPPAPVSMVLPERKTSMTQDRTSASTVGTPASTRSRR